MVTNITTGWNTFVPDLHKVLGIKSLQVSSPVELLEEKVESEETSDQKPVEFKTVHEELICVTR